MRITLESDDKTASNYIPNMDKINGHVILAYLMLCVQTVEYIKPNKFSFTEFVAGMTTDGELITAPDRLPLFDLPGYEIEDSLDVLAASSDFNGVIKQFYSKHGFNVASFDDIDVYTNADRIQANVICNLSPFINEYTYDILPQSLFIPLVYDFHQLFIAKEIPNLRSLLCKRKRTLPSNGVLVKINTTLMTSILLKETFYDDSIIMLFRIESKQGSISGSYDTRKQYMFSSFTDYGYTEVRDTFLNFVLFIYACYVLSNETICLNLLGDYFKYLSVPITAEGYLQGGKLRNVLRGDKDKLVSNGTRINDERYTQEARAVQGYIRKLPAGQMASEKAIELAESLGYDLSLNETYVQPFVKHVFKLKERTE